MEGSRTVGTEEDDATVIDGLGVRDFAYLWVSGGCLLHQWCSGARALDREVYDYVAKLWRESGAVIRDRAGRRRREAHRDRKSLGKLRRWMLDRIGRPASPYVADLGDVETTRIRTACAKQDEWTPVRLRGKQGKIARQIVGMGICGRLRAITRNDIRDGRQGDGTFELSRSGLETFLLRLKDLADKEAETDDRRGDTPPATDLYEWMMEVLEKGDAEEDD